jgi:hypothetical protein
MRTVVQRTWQAQQSVKSWPVSERGTWPKALAAFPKPAALALPLYAEV